MKWCYQVEVDETETSKTKQEIIELGLNVLAETFSKLGCYYDIGFNPNMITTNKTS